MEKNRLTMSQLVDRTRSDIRGRKLDYVDPDTQYAGDVTEVARIGKYILYVCICILESNVVIC